MGTQDEHLTRADGLASLLSNLPREAAAAEIAKLASDGEDAAILTLVHSWLDLPPLPLPIKEGSLIASHYTLREKLGEGGMSTVWRAHQKFVERDVALKMIPPALISPAFQTKFKEEMVLLGKLSHANIVKIFGAGLHHQEGYPPIPFFTMDLIDGLPLAKWAEAHRADWKAQLDLAEAVCGAVQSAHERGIVHRDLKPANIMVKPGGEPVILDFGIARLMGESTEADAGNFSGTPQYAPPEQHLGRDRDFRSGESVDIYALGAVLFETLAGRRLFQFSRGTSLAEMRRAVINAPRPHLADTLPGCPPKLDELIARAVRPDPNDRYHSMAEFRRAIKNTSAALNLSQVTAPAWRPSAGVLVPGTQWRLVEMKGEGAAGQVWLAIDEASGQSRIFKFCDSEDKARTLKRELTLFQILKDRLGQNPHFIPIHGIALEDPPWYLMMEDAKASDLQHWCKAQAGGLSSMALETRLEIAAQVAEALQSAHEAGILHRDIKPANILVKPGESGLEIHILIADFGIGQIIAGQLLGEGTRKGFTKTATDVRRAAFAGTLLYMAPEILEGGEATPQSDIYSLGVVLWQLLTGDLSVALDATGWSERIDDPLLREDLTRCLAGQPANRWSSAAALAISLRDLPARRITEKERKKRIVELERIAYRRGVTRTTAVAVAVAVLLGWLGWLAREKSIYAESQRKLANEARVEATLGELHALLELQSGEARVQLFNKVPKLEFTGKTDVIAFRNTAAAILTLPEFQPLIPCPLPLREGSRFSGNGERLIAPGGKNGEAQVLDLTREPPLARTFAKAGSILSNQFITGSGLMAGAVVEDGKLQIWDLRGRNPTNIYQIDGPVHQGCFAISPITLATIQKNIVAVARPDGAIEIFVPGLTNQPLRLLRRSTETENYYPESFPATMMAFSLVQEGVLAAAGPASGNLLFWKIVDQKSSPMDGHLAGAAWHPHTITCMAWNPVADEIATGCQDGILRIWPFAFTGTNPQISPARSIDLGEPISDAAWNSDGSLIAVLMKSGSVQILQGRALERPPIGSFLAAAASHVAFSIDQTLYAWGAGQGQAWGSGSSPFFAERRISSSRIHTAYQQQGSLMASAQNRIQFLNPSSLGWTGGFKTASRNPACWQGSTLIYHNAGWQRADVTNAANAPQSLEFGYNATPITNAVLIISSPQGRRCAWVADQKLRSMAGSRDEGVSVPMPDLPPLLAISDALPMSAWSDTTQTVHVFQHLGARERRFEFGSAILGLDFATEPDLLAVRTQSGISFLNPDTGEKADLQREMASYEFSPIAFSPDGHWIIVCEVGHSLSMVPVPPAEARRANCSQAWRDAFAKALKIPSPASHRTVSLAWNAQASRLARGTADGLVQTWNLSLLFEKLRLLGLDRDDLPHLQTSSFVPISLK